MNKEMHKRLSALVGKDVLVSLYTDTDEPDEFTLGYLLEIDSDNVLLNTIDSHGEENGFCTINLEDVFIFDGDKQYSEQVQRLFSIKNQKRRYIAELNGNPILDFLKYAADNELLTVVNDDRDYKGYVSYYSPDILELRIISHYWDDMGTATIDMNNINCLRCQDKYLKDLELLYDDAQGAR